MRRALVCLAAAMCAVTLCGQVAAQSESDADAARAFADAERAFAASDFEAALSGFRKAHSLHHHDVTLFNIGVCLERLGRFKEASSAYTQASQSAQLTPAERQRARELADQMRARLAVVSLSGERGAQVLVDGQPQCSLPCDVELDPGTHRASVALGNRRWTRGLELERGARLAVEVKLPPPPPDPAPAVDARPVAASSTPPTWLTWVGAGAVVGGAAGFTYFGVRARELNDEYEAHPTRDTLDEGRLHQLLANVALGVAAVGAVGIALDLFVLHREEEPSRRPRARASDAVRLTRRW